MHYLFRRESISNHRNRLSGDVAIAVPVAWQTIALAIFGSMSLGVLFLSLASYSRVETVTGAIAPDTGIATIVPTRPGVVAELRVCVGQGAPSNSENCRRSHTIPDDATSA